MFIDLIPCGASSDRLHYLYIFILFSDALLMWTFFFFFFCSITEGFLPPGVDCQYSGNTYVKREGQGGIYMTPTGNEFHESVSMPFC